MRLVHIVLVLALIAGVADIATTTYGVENTSLEESNYQLQQAMDIHGTIVAHIFVKAIAFSTILVLSTLVEPAYRFIPLLGVVLIWGGATLWNLALIL